MKKRLEKRGFEEGYTEALSDLNHGFYESWVKEIKGDYAKMAEEILKAMRDKFGKTEFEKRLERYEGKK